jgi:DNA gyrase subunit B
MNELVMNGHLYIAQPPLYKAKKGKKVVYLKDDKALTEFLFDQGARKLSIEAQGRSKPLENDDVLAFLGAIRGFNNLLEKTARQKDGRVLHAFLESYEGDKVVMKDKATMEVLRDRIKARLGELHRGDDLRLTQLDLQHSEDFDAWELVARTRDSGVDKSTHIGWDFVTSGEMLELHRLYREVLTYGRPGFVVHREKGEPLEFATELDLYAWIDKESRRGYDIQRYKGLGEMNPDQLWDTTMDPEVRTLIQVKVDDIVEADEIFTILMGDAVDPRRNFIEQNALKVKNLDV